MNFNSQETQTLETLLAALGNGVSPSAVNPWLQQTLAQQASRVQAKKERMQNWASQVSQLASVGYPQGAAQTYMDLATPNREGVPPGIQGLLNTAFPKNATVGGQEWAPGQNYRYDFPVGADVTDPYGYANSQFPYAQQQSNLYLQGPEFQSMVAEQQAAQQQAVIDQQEAQQEALGDSQVIAEIAQGILTGKQNGMTFDQIAGTILSNPDYSEVFLNNLTEFRTLFATTA